MSFLHERKSLDAGDVVELDCDTQCNFMLMDDSNFASYRRRGAFNYHGGHFRYFPAEIVVPRSGTWNVVIDLGGGRANIRYGLRYISAT